MSPAQMGPSTGPIIFPGSHMFTLLRPKPGMSSKQTSEAPEGRPDVKALEP